MRLASKSLRVRTLQERALAAGFAGRSASRSRKRSGWPRSADDDLVVAYPTVDRGALRELAHDARRRVTVMVDCREHLDAIEAARGRLEPIRVCIDIDAGWHALGGPARSERSARRCTIPPRRGSWHARSSRGPEFELDGLMAYEAQIAGVGDRPPGKRLMRLALPSAVAVGARAGAPAR